MLSSSATLAAVQGARAASLPRHLAETPARSAILEGFRQRNALLDGLFYDIGAVSPTEGMSVAPDLAAEGAILIVPPTGAGSLTLHRSVDDFVAAGSPAKTLVVAGVGSSALGTAAFARNVADAIGQPVVGVVSGYGLADLVTEALGGYFLFGALNTVRHHFEALDRRTEAGVISEPLPSLSTVRESRDTRTIVALLTHPGLRFELLAGHSKGNLVLSEGLFELRAVDRARYDRTVQDCRIVTVSARVAMPREFTGVIDIMGEWDWFGGLNSRPAISPDHVVPMAWHHTNTELPAHLPVTKTLHAVL